MKLTLLIFTLAVSMATAFVETDIDDETEINSFIELLLQSAKQQAGDCRNCLTGFDMFVQTSSGAANALAIGSYDVEISFVGGEKQRVHLPDIPLQNQAKLYSFALKDCFTIFDVTNITLIAVSTDGWNIQSIVTYFVDDKGRYFSGSIDRNVYSWVDHKDKPEHKSFVLNLSSHG